jgi:hypothetical protein
LRNVEIYNHTGALVRVITVTPRQIPDGPIAIHSVVLPAQPVTRAARKYSRWVGCDSLAERKALAHRKVRRVINARLAAIVDGRTDEDGFDPSLPRHLCDGRDIA